MSGINPGAAPFLSSSSPVSHGSGRGGRLSFSDSEANSGSEPPSPAAEGRGKAPVGVGAQLPIVDARAAVVVRLVLQRASWRMRGATITLMVCTRPRPCLHFALSSSTRCVSPRSLTRMASIKCIVAVASVVGCYLTRLGRFRRTSSASASTASAMTTSAPYVCSRRVAALAGARGIAPAIARMALSRVLIKRGRSPARSGGGWLGVLELKAI